MPLIFPVSEVSWMGPILEPITSNLRVKDDRIYNYMKLKSKNKEIMKYFKGTIQKANSN